MNNLFRFKSLVGYGLLLWISSCCVANVTLTDPTKPVWQAVTGNQQRAAQAVIGKSLQLQAVLQRELKPLVVINGQTLAVGQKIAGYQLIKIEQYAALLRAQEKTIELSLINERIKITNE